MKVETSTGRGRYVDGEWDTVFVPRWRRRSPLVVYCHPSGGDGRRVADPQTSEHRLLAGLASHGFAVVAADLGGASATWANDLAVARIEQVIGYARGRRFVRGDDVRLIGNSMGAADMLAYVQRGATSVSAVVAIAPVWEVARLRELGADDLRTNIDAAWGVEWPAALPAGADPAGFLRSIEVPRLLAFYASDDPLIPPASVERFAEIGGGRAVDLGAVGHATAVDHVPVDHVVAFFRGVDRLVNAPTRRRRS